MLLTPRSSVVDDDEEQPNIEPQIETVPTPQPRTEDVGSSFSESEYKSDNDDLQPNSKGEIKFGSPFQSKLEEIDSPSSESGSHSDDDEQGTMMKAEMEANPPQPRFEDVEGSSSESGSDSSEAKEGQEGEGADDDWEDVDTSSKDSSVKRVSGVAPTPGLSEINTASLAQFDTKSKPFPPTVELDPSATSSTTLGFTKSPLPTPTANVEDTSKPDVQVNDSTNLAPEISEPFNPKFREVLMGPNFNLSSSDVDKLATKLRTAKVNVNVTSNGTEEATKDQVTRDEDLANPQPVLPRWFSQKVRKILESPGCPESLAPKVPTSMPLTTFYAYLQ